MKVGNLFENQIIELSCQSENATQIHCSENAFINEK